MSAGLAMPQPLLASTPHEQVEWTWAAFPDHVVPGLPNVLLEGDSITRNYYPYVQRLLAGKANVFLFATSACVGDPRLAQQVRAYRTLASQSFAVIHFNNGMHGWGISEQAYRAGFPNYLAAIESLTPGAKLIWATTTNMRLPVANGGSNVRIAARNHIADQALEKTGIVIDHQNGLMRDQISLYQDDIHFGAAGAERQAEQVVATIAKALSLTGGVARQTDAD